MAMLPNATLDSLGERLRKARKDRGLSQEKLAQPEFTKSYVSAVERGKARPSLKALTLMAGRLQLPVTDLLADATPVGDLPDLLALGRGLEVELDHANILLNTNQASEALR